MAWGKEGKEDFRRRSCPNDLKPPHYLVGGFKSSPRAAVWDGISAPSALFLQVTGGLVPVMIARRG